MASACWKFTATLIPAPDHAGVSARGRDRSGGTLPAIRSGYIVAGIGQSWSVIWAMACTLFSDAGARETDQSAARRFISFCRQQQRPPPWAAERPMSGGLDGFKIPMLPAVDYQYWPP